MSLFSSVSFNSPMSAAMLEMVEFYDFVWFFMIIVLSVVSSCFVVVVVSPPFFTNTYREGQALEVIWLLLPAALLTILAFPSMRLLYSVESAAEPLFTLKVVGHQWYWSYSYPDFSGMKDMDSYIKPTGDLKLGEPRLLEVTSRVWLPYLTEIRAMITSADVLHSWAVPSLGLKVDAVPGRLNQVGMCSFKSGLCYGQCSELCGVNHSFMPICLAFVSWEDFSDWVFNI